LADSRERRAGNQAGQHLGEMRPDRERITSGGDRLSRPPGASQIDPFRTLSSVLSRVPRRRNFPEWPFNAARRDSAQLHRVHEMWSKAAAAMIRQF
jgi:hypothetical protein